MEVTQIFGITFIGIIVVCLVWTISSYIYRSYSPSNKLEENLKKFDDLTNKKYK